MVTSPPAIGQEKSGAEVVERALHALGRDQLLVDLAFPGADSPFFALDAVHDDEGHPLLIDVNYRVWGSWAAMQSAGRGRRNRSWVSPFASNLCLSLLWRSDCGIAGLGGMSLVCGVAVLRCLEQFGITSGGVQWPNDVLVNDAKLAGILIDVIGEATGSCAVIVGVGINVAMPEQASEQIGQPWTDLCSLTGMAQFPRNLLAARTLDTLLAAIGEFTASGLQGFLDDWSRYDVMAGRQVDVHLPGETVSGRACGIDETGALLVQTASGHQRFASGEVSVRVAP